MREFEAILLVTFAYTVLGTLGECCRTICSPITQPLFPRPNDFSRAFPLSLCSACDRHGLHLAGAAGSKFRGPECSTPSNGATETPINFFGFAGPK